MKFLPLILICALLCIPAFARAETVAITSWLTAGPFSAPEPLFLDSADQTGLARYLDTDADYHDWQPKAKASIEWYPGETGAWTERTDSTLNWPILESAPRVVLAATYISASRWQETPFVIHSTGPVAAWLDGKLIDKQSKAKDNLYELKPTLTLHRGKHLLLIKSVSDTSRPLTIQASVAPDSQFARALSFSTDYHRSPAVYSDWSFFHEISGPVVSPDGKLAAVIHYQRDEKYRRDGWLEVHDTRTGALVDVIRHAKGISGAFFFPRSGQLGYLTSDDDGSSLWSYDLKSHEERLIADKLKGWSRFECSPDDKYIYFAADDEANEAEQKANYRHFDKLEDKVTDWTSRRRLFVLSVAGGVVHDLSVRGDFAFDDFALSREGDRIAFLRYVPRTGRPYYDSEIWVYNVPARKAERVVSMAMTEPPGRFAWLPGGKQIAFAAGSHTVSPADTVFPNTNHHLLYLLDLPSGKVSSLSEGQIFSVEDVQYNARDRQIYVSGAIGGEVGIFKTGTGGGKFTRLKFDRPLVNSFQLSRDGSVLVLSASSITQPFAAFASDLNSGKETELLDPNAGVMEQFRLGSSEKFDFTNSDGDRIEGWLYFPPDFTPDRKWPTLVYYYGGVIPRDERFSFTYEWLNANGYVVYVLNPVGCIGYGQAFADKHSNDWGTLATRDVLEGTQKLVAAKPYVDEKHLGAFGGSYGGFITLDLVTKTDMFAAAIDMYGISNITNYFGAGTWGHIYGDLALPGSYPWSRKDVFVDKSPIFHADKIKTPLLILHGEADNNVPPSESDQMFAALKILGRDAEYVRFKDESHNINLKFEDLISHREMMLEWFDKYLKGEPEAWAHRWKSD